MCYITIHRTLCEICGEILEYRKALDQTCSGKRKTNRCNIHVPPDIKIKRLDCSNCLVCVARRASLEAARSVERERRALKEQLAREAEREAEMVKKEEEESEEDKDVKKEEELEEAEMEEQAMKKELVKEEHTMVREKNGRVENWIDGVLELKRKPSGKKD
jgi:flagellar biosynthesis GTPase FlhF